LRCLRVSVSRSRGFRAQGSERGRRRRRRAPSPPVSRVSRAQRPTATLPPTALPPSTRRVHAHQPHHGHARARRTANSNTGHGPRAQLYSPRARTPTTRDRGPPHTPTRTRQSRHLALSQAAYKKHPAPRRRACSPMPWRRDDRSRHATRRMLSCKVSFSLFDRSVTKPPAHHSLRAPWPVHLAAR
jgi:hypothetical protein